MNQILVIPANLKYKKILKIQLILSIFFTISLISFHFYSVQTRNKNESISKNLLNTFNISLLYANNSSYTANTLSSSNSFSIIGIIEIKKLKINYPIISEINDSLLEMSPCKFYGPNPNEIGNFCIAGHNYNDNRFFSRISTLKYADIISITDLTGNTINYSVTDIFETTPNDLSCISQETNGQKEITLISCNNITEKRVIVKAREFI